MKVNSCDISVQGFERLRTNDEFILAAPIDCEAMPEAVLESLLCDLAHCDRGDDFDWPGAEHCVKSWLANNWDWVKLECARIPPIPEDADFEDYVLLWLYIEG